ncbi:hypothetical protein LTR04_004813, partial [Oleoguttula sp. CCFEE 6159]
MLSLTLTLTLVDVLVTTFFYILYPRTATPLSRELEARGALLEQLQGTATDHEESFEEFKEQSAKFAEKYENETARRIEKVAMLMRQHQEIERLRNEISEWKRR